MLFILEILFLVFGIYAIITAKFPAFLIGGGKYRIEGPSVRWLGLFLVAPLPLSAVVYVIADLVFGLEGIVFATLFELGLIVLVAIIAMVVVRRIRQPL